jgi:sulfur-oxidizing protein SoxB
MVKDWRFGIREGRLQELVDEARGKGAQVVTLLSHNGMDIDIKLASRVKGIHAILGGHTHDAVPVCMEVKNGSDKTLVVNSGSSGKFLSLLDLDVKNGKIADYQYRLIPVFSNLIPAHKKMQEHIETVRAPHEKKLSKVLAVSNSTLYRRGTFNGTFDQLICDALMDVMDAEISFSPGFRWGMNILQGQPITFEDVMTQTAITYPQSVRNNMTGENIKSILEDIADNRFNPDPYLQQGGDMVRIGGMTYTIDPTAKMGNRIQDIQVKGKPIDAKKEYSVARWADVNENSEGPPVWDIVSEYLQDKKEITVSEVNIPKLKNVKNDTGIDS